MSADREARFLELLGPNSKNFMGTGLSMADFMRLGLAEKYAASWSNQDLDERRRRLSAVMALSVELAAIRVTTLFAIRLCELAIESIIEGDWKMVSEWADHLTFSTEGEELRAKEAPVFARFRELLLQAARGGEAGAS